PEDDLPLRDGMRTGDAVVAPEFDRKPRSEVLTYLIGNWRAAVIPVIDMRMIAMKFGHDSFLPSGSRDIQPTLPGSRNSNMRRNCRRARRNGPGWLRLASGEAVISVFGGTAVAGFPSRRGGAPVGVSNVSSWPIASVCGARRPGSYRE